MELFETLFSAFDWLPVTVRAFAVGAVIAFLLFALLKLIKFVLGFLPFFG